MANGAVVGVGVDCFGEVEVGENPMVVEETNVVGVSANFNDSMLFSKVAPRRCSKVSRSGGTGFVGWF